ncbi:hypothetical protein IT408_00655 [Candidatus Uhrbacteria bacterium]|nr:hypothetical protein [Candidatus Uhrbacteria bacterium]
MERVRALERTTAIHVSMLQLVTQAGLKLEDRSIGGCHIYLAQAGSNPIWNLNFSIQFDVSIPLALSPLSDETSHLISSACKPNVIASLCLQYARKQVLYFQYDGRHDYWTLEAETDTDDADIWDTELPFRKNIKSGECIDSHILREKWQNVVQSIIEFYLKRSESVYPRRMCSLPPPPSIPPGELELTAQYDERFFVF